ncbi:conserved Plasmodium protein, unknown function [Plasmodium berghei]|uniref:Armadillo repeat protein, putative n=2 Tax=Plasmodium berghei TaxID=5821 RepID=A0A509AHQ0_PLABA|nr:armadillo repeat protein, putative [Plasmodium berghei ANKA]SCM21460.1 conserved Plasmodium protein, unknown function [Plasmodium berghei]SCN24677.1 conserved Plasmodium protein, unknown function [Plasmodium berghei]SCO59826.1 conserved Plasmodium protein, unknown function [Plasmodium berghei]SCO61112.1 conserved Plasmodium protein, unknown function [Plasmodium berghei]VUC55425.1 armadillo repeat protein, putative [Plasmodium berghei ANKA]|eukprot:XP_034421238.1 armadillo repeat protein, putative [Plasmodium berghei ANKA]
MDSDKKNLEEDIGCPNDETENDILRNKIVKKIDKKNNDENKKNEKNNEEIKKKMSIIEIHKFINRLKNTNIKSLEKNDLIKLENDIKTLNISKYLSEIISYILNLSLYINKYSDLFILLNILKYICLNYNNVDYLIEKLIFIKFFKLDEKDKNYFFIIFHDIYNNIDEHIYTYYDKTNSLENIQFYENIISDEKRISEMETKINTKCETSEFWNLEIQENDNKKTGDLKIEQSYVWTQKLNKIKSEVFKKMASYIYKENHENIENQTFLFQNNLIFSSLNGKQNYNNNKMEFVSFPIQANLGNDMNSKNKIWSKNNFEKKIYIQEMLKDCNIFKKIEKQNNLRKILLCLYFELVLLKMCNNKDMLIYMFINITFYSSLNIDPNISGTETGKGLKSSLSKLGPYPYNIEKKNNDKLNEADTLNMIKRCLSVNAIVAYDYFFTNTMSLFSDIKYLSNSCKEHVDKVDGIEEKRESEGKSGIEKDEPRNKFNLDHMKDVKKYIVEFFNIFYKFGIYKILIYLYAEHVDNEYRDNSKKLTSNDYFFKIYNKSKKFCLFFTHLNKYNLNQIQIEGIQLLGVDKNSYNYIINSDFIKKQKNKTQTFLELSNNSLITNQKNNNCVDIEHDEICYDWNNNEEKNFYTVFPEYSNININLNDDENDEENSIIEGVENKNLIEKDGENILKKKKSKHNEFLNYTNKIININNEKDLENMVMIFLLNYNTKKKRKIIATKITYLNKITLNLIPFYCRYIAIINKYTKDICLIIIDELKRIIEKDVKNKLPCQNKKMKCIKYICELVKFKLLDMSYILDILNLLIENFTQDHAELCFYILENSAILLVSNSKTHIRFLYILQKLKKIKNTKNISSSLENIFEECCIRVKKYLTEKTKKNMSFSNKNVNFDLNKINYKGDSISNKLTNQYKKKKYFLKKLLFQDINANNNDENIYLISKYIRKFNWDEKFISHFLNKYIYKYLKYMSIYQINKIASLLYYIAIYKPQFVIHIIDNLNEKIIKSFEENDFKNFAYLIQYAHLFSGLYIYKILNSSNVFDMLYFLLSFSDASMSNASNIFEMYKLFSQNLKFIKMFKNKILPKNILIPNEENRKINFQTVCDLSNMPLKSGENKRELFYYDGDIENFSKFLFINNKNPILNNMLNDQDNNSFINIRMICIIIENCFKYFNNIPLLKFKLNIFFLFFIRFLLIFESLPIYIKITIDNILKQGGLSMSYFKTIKDVDKILFVILNYEYKIFQNEIKEYDKNNDELLFFDSDLNFKFENDENKDNKKLVSNTSTKYIKDIRQNKIGNKSDLNEKNTSSSFSEYNQIEINEMDNEINQIIKESIDENRLTKNKTQTSVNYKKKFYLQSFIKKGIVKLC